jgi:hypothetical protein
MIEENLPLNIKAYVNNDSVEIPSRGKKQKEEVLNERQIPSRKIQIKTSHGR